MHPQKADHRLQQIHDWMARSNEYQGISATAIALAGAYALLGGLVQALVDFPFSNRLAFVMIWSTVFLLAVITNILLIWNKSKKQGDVLFSRLSKTALFALAPNYLGAGVLTVVLLHQRQVALLPGIWMVLNGCALLAVRFFVPSPAGLIGLLFFICGVCTFGFFPGEKALHPVVMALPFSSLHFLFSGLMHLYQKQKNQLPQGVIS